jgi:hypothetical protein
LRYLVEEGFVVREDGRYVAQQGVGAGIPEGLRDVVGKRLSRLSEMCNRLLSVAAVIGRDFDLQTLRSVANLNEDELLGAVEEAVRVGVLEERALPGMLRYRFAHAFFRQALYEEMIAARRLRLHQEVARALEAQYASRREEHAAELAEHYGQSTDRADLAKAIEYSEMAARRAMAVFAYAEAEEHLRKCLEVQEVLDPEDKRRLCELLLALGEAILPQPNPGRVVEISSTAGLRLAEALPDALLAARIAIQGAEGTYRSAGIFGDPPGLAYWAGKARSHAQAGSAEWILAGCYLGLLALADDRVRAHEYLISSVNESVRLNDNAVFFAAAAFAFQYLNSLQDRQYVFGLVQEVLSTPRHGVRTSYLALCLSTAEQRLVARGDLEEAKLVASELRELASRTADSMAARIALDPEIPAAVRAGQLEEALSRLQEAHRFSREAGLLLNTGNINSIIRTLIYLGRFEELLFQLTGQGLWTANMRGAAAARSLAFALLGKAEEAQAARSFLKGIESPEDQTHALFLAYIFESAIISRDMALVHLLLVRFTPFSGDSIAGTCIDRLLAEANLLLGDRDAARKHFEGALDLSLKMQHRPEIAVTHLGLAELLLDHYPEERDAAIEHLDFAIAEFQDMKMQPALERALRHRGLLKA